MLILLSIKIFKLYPFHKYVNYDFCYDVIIKFINNNFIDKETQKPKTL